MKLMKWHSRDILYGQLETTRSSLRPAHAQDYWARPLQPEQLYSRFLNTAWRFENIDGYSGAINWFAYIPWLPVELTAGSYSLDDIGSTQQQLQNWQRAENLGSIRELLVRDSTDLLAVLEEGQAYRVSRHQVTAVEQLSAYSGEWTFSYEYQMLFYRRQGQSQMRRGVNQLLGGVRISGD